MDGPHDRSSRPRRSPTRVPSPCRGQDLQAAVRLELPASTIYRVLRRRDLNRLDRFDQATGRPIRRYERSRPGEPIHVDVKKLAQVPVGGGHKVHGRSVECVTRRKKHLGYAYVHSAVDDHSRLAYTEILTDNGFCHRGRLFNEARRRHRHRAQYCRPYRPRTNGKVCVSIPLTPHQDCEDRNDAAPTDLTRAKV